MQRLLCKYAGDPHLTELDPGQLETVSAECEWLWLDLTDSHTDEIDRVGTLFGFDPLNINDVIDVTLFPKVDDAGDYLFVVLHYTSTDEDRRLTTKELDIFIGKRFLVTAHRTPMVTIDRVAQHALAGSRLGAEGPAAVAAAIAEAGSRRYFPLLDALEDRIEDLEDHAIAANPQTLSDTQALRHDAIVLRRILGPQRDVLRQLSQSLSPIIEPSSRAFADVYDHYFRLVEMLDAARGLLSGVLETYRGAVAERTNEVMKVLTVFSAILLPLGVIAGLWGMNFSDLPGSQWRWGFAGLLGVMALIAIGLWLYFVRRGFIGGPRLRDLPRSVGLGLVHISMAPLRAASSVLPVTGRNRTAEPAPPPGSGHDSNSAG